MGFVFDEYMFTSGDDENINHQIGGLKISIDGYSDDFFISWIHLRRPDRIMYFKYAVYHKQSGTMLSLEADPDQAIRAAKKFVDDWEPAHMRETFLANAERIKKNEQVAFERRAGKYGTQALADHERVGAVYLIKSAGRYKIGQSVNPRQRISGMSLSEKPETLVIHHTPKWKQAEKELHMRFAHKRGHGEWFDFAEQELEEVEKAIRAF